MADLPNNPHCGHRTRLKQNYIEAGSLEGFSENQILEMLLFYSMPRKNMSPLAHTLIERFGSLHGVLNAAYSALIDFGLSENTAALIKLIGDFPIPIAVNIPPGEAVVTVNNAMNLCLSLVRNLCYECICIICLDSAFKLLHYEVIAVGEPSETHFSLKYAVKTAEAYKAAGIVFGHSRPMGNCLPSAIDIINSANLRNLLKRIGVSLFEYITVTFPGCYAIIKNIGRDIIESTLFSLSADGSIRIWKSEDCELQE